MAIVAGVYQKYEVRKTDGTATDPGARYFVMRLDTDAHARRAAGAYAESVARENPELAADLLELLRNNPQRGPRRTTLVARALTAFDIRKLAQAGRILVRHVEHCVPHEKLAVTWAFTRQIEAIVGQVICYRCGGLGRVPDHDVERACLECDGTGIA